ncbi:MULTISPECIES: signal recognition particle-docking protein FtsY [Cyanophyceae]|uniref:Signal recognition particle receptor FtsY n=1 Tax=Nodularia spumigena CENA596 TaxID=1819295 RepID=A0A161VWE3_NODSP|nr:MULTISPECIES: signal recognition particle-docking protein FtsY [Cyanophyceae]MDB9358179.1 signal recognition particle-docking protein FtsY [Nodularia spumigena CS-587/03]KZL51735.1 signal recognition particle-docking protein FtsY [Nodularia spumigena CENA596]MDB9304844.1 signal recognition particle-docking protein FtsY [Nodularia spumigena CS-591/12]MDB9318859.1 signal recognition particle-docking protein FtsY [Nodularia spumigena CS-590/01A]MDB9320529.1 signal recognition particle-docking 
MVFNWFRRKYNDSSDTPPEQKPEETPSAPETQPEPAVTPTPTADTAQDSTADLLAFAKSAYKNIQQKQQTPEVETAADAVEVEAPPETVETVETVADTVEVEAPPAPETVEAAADAVEVEPPAPPETVEEAAAKSEVTPTAPTEEPETTPTAPAPSNLSFLERAAAERQAKQERLIASAIEVPEPVLQPAATTTETAEEVGGLAFDEGFVWSAEVLAAQGRRPEDVSIEEITWLKKLRQGLGKTRRNILNQLKAIVGQGPLNQAAVDEIETALLQADVGVEATDYIISALQKKLLAEVTPPEEAIAYLKQILRDMLDAPLQKAGSPSFTPEKETLNIWLITGVNGAGKTTTIGKISHLAQKSGYKCLIGAADTFRAAAVEQVKVWGNRSGVEVIANPGKNTDPAAVVFDAIAAAQARETELLLVDTAGRLQNKKNLMDELAKIRRIIDKKAPNAKIESLLVLDATLGQNGLRQAEVFAQAAQLSGVVLTKLDGTAKGGVALAVVQQLGLPIRFIGAGEGMEDLRPFSSYEFVEALLSG